MREMKLQELKSKTPAELVQFAADNNPHSQRYYRIINEIPTVLMILIVLLAVVKPF